jgi:hypothetical protein
MAQRKPSRHIVSELGMLTLPVLIWGLHFTSVYGATALLCAGDFAATIKQALAWTIVFAATVFALLLIILSGKFVAANAQNFVSKVFKALSILAIFAIMAGDAAAIFVQACVEAR